MKAEGRLASGLEVEDLKRRGQSRKALGFGTGASGRREVIICSARGSGRGGLCEAEEFCFRHTEFEMPLRRSSGKIEWAAGYMSLKGRERSRTRDINLGVVVD